MKIKLFMKGKSLNLKQSDKPWLETDTKCPHCPCYLDVRSNECHIARDGRHYEGAAYCVACKAAVGTLKVYPNTLFGIEEDNAVLGTGRARVY